MPELKKEKLLIAPVITFWELWLEGYFETVTHEELHSEDVWSEHCFYDHGNGYYYDADDHRISRLHALRLKLSGVPCGKAGLTTVMGIDHVVSDALGIPRSYD